jgi:hypothetical protein
VPTKKKFGSAFNFRIANGFRINKIRSTGNWNLSSPVRMRGPDRVGDPSRIALAHHPVPRDARTARTLGDRSWHTRALSGFGSCRSHDAGRVEDDAQSESAAGDLTAARRSLVGIVHLLARVAAAEMARGVDGGRLVAAEPSL